MKSIFFVFVDMIKELVVNLLTFFFIPFNKLPSVTPDAAKIHYTCDSIGV